LGTPGSAGEQIVDFELVCTAGRVILPEREPMIFT
jgi:hypothetical protein